MPPLNTPTVDEDVDLLSVLSDALDDGAHVRLGGQISDVDGG